MPERLRVAEYDERHAGVLRDGQVDIVGQRLVWDGQLRRANTERSHERTFKCALWARKVSISREMSVVYPVTQGVFIYTRGPYESAGVPTFLRLGQSW